MSCPDLTTNVPDSLVKCPKEEKDFFCNLFWGQGKMSLKGHLLKGFFRPTDNLSIGKANTQKIERKNLTLRTRIKRLARKSICFSKSKKMHDIVIGMFINRYEFLVPI